MNQFVNSGGRSLKRVLGKADVLPSPPHTPVVPHTWAECTACPLRGCNVVRMQ